MLTALLRTVYVYGCSRSDNQSCALYGTECCTALLNFPINIETLYDSPSQKWVVRGRFGEAIFTREIEMKKTSTTSS